MGAGLSSFLLPDADLPTSKVGRALLWLSTRKVLHLHYAWAEELGSLYLYMVAAQGEVYVQFWLRPGDPPVEMTPEGGGAGGGDTEGVERVFVGRSNTHGFHVPPALTAALRLRLSGRARWPPCLLALPGGCDLT